MYLALRFSLVLHLVTAAGAFAPSVRAQAATTTAKQAARVISGQVLDEKDTPLSAVDVHWVTYFGPRLIAPDRLELVDRTDEGGRFEFDWEKYDKAGHRSGFLFRKKGFANVWYKHIPRLALPPFRMRPGYTLSGVVRDVSGKPVAGATVVSIDMLATWESFLHTMIFAPRINVACTKTDDSGRFRLSGVLAHGLDVVFSHPRHLVHERFAVDVGDPLNITLKPGGRIRGRVLDQHGRPFVGIKVAMKHETIRWRYRVYAAPVVTDAQGRFEMPRTESYPYRFNIGTGVPPIGFFSESFTGDREDLEFKLDFAPKPAAGKAPAKPANPKLAARLGVRLIVTASDKRGPVPELEAAVMRATGENIRFKSGAYWADRFAKTKQRGAGGQLDLTAPFLFSEPALIAVRAAGYATKLVDVARGAPPEKEPKRFAVQLEPAARIHGVVRNLETGKAVPGAQVAVNYAPRPYLDWRRDSWRARTSARSWPDYGLTKTDKLGRFAFDHLKGGRFDVFAYKSGCPLSVTTKVALADGETRNGVVVGMLGPTTLDLSFVGVPRFDPGWRVRVGRPYLERLRGSKDDRDQSYAVPISAQGKATIKNAGPGEHELELLVEHPFRLGGVRRKLDIRRLVIAKHKTALEVDLAKTAPTPLRGRVHRTGSPIAMHRLIVVAEPVDLDVAPRVRAEHLSLQGARAFVGEDGAFVLACPPGKVRLLVVDAATGVIFTMSEPIEHGPKQAAGHELTVAIARLRLTLKRGKSGALPGRVEIRCAKLWPGGVGRMAPRPTVKDTRAGAWLTEGQEEVVLYLPDAPVDLWVRTGTDTWRTRSKNRIYAKVPYVPKPGVTERLEVEIGGGR